MTAFVKNLNQLYSQTPEALADLMAITKGIKLSKGEYLLQSGERAQHCYFLNSGILRVFHTQDGNEYNKTFFLPGMFPTPITALLSNKASELSFQALTDAELVQFSYQKFRALFQKHRCIESLMLRIMEQLWIKKEQHDIRMVTNNATVNYRLFQEEYPELENQIAQYHIASYLGITPIQLSRIRASHTS